MAVIPTNTNKLDLSFNRGIDGSSAISSIQEGFCVNLENADLSTVGVIRKRPGYNVYNHKLPAKYLYSYEDRSPTNARDNNFTFDYTPLFSIGFKAYPNTKEMQASLGLEVTSDDLYNTVICRITTELPNDFTLNSTHFLQMFEEGGSVIFNRIVQPLEIINNTTFIMSVGFGLIGASYVPTTYYALKAQILTGHVLPRITSESIETISQTSTTTLNIEFKDTPELCLNDIVYFESGVYFTAGAGYPNNNFSGYVSSITGNVVTITMAGSGVAFNGSNLQENITNQYTTPASVRTIPTSVTDNLVANNIQIRANYSTTPSDFRVYIYEADYVLIGVGTTLIGDVVTFAGVSILSATLDISTGVLDVTLDNRYFTTSSEVFVTYKVVTGTVGYTPVTIGTISPINFALRYCPRYGIFSVNDVNGNLLKLNTIEIRNINQIASDFIFDSTLKITSKMYPQNYPVIAGTTITHASNIRDDRFTDITKMYITANIGGTEFIFAKGSYQSGTAIIFTSSVSGDTIPATVPTESDINYVAGYSNVYFGAASLDISTGVLSCTTAGADINFADELVFTLTYYKDSYNYLGGDFYGNSIDSGYGFLYGTNAQIGLIEAVGNLNEVAVVANNGNVFSEYTYYSTTLKTKTALYCATSQTLTAVSNEFTIPAKYKRIDNSTNYTLVTTSNYYISGDYVSVGGYNLLVKSVTATDIIVDSGGLTTLNIAASEKISFIRTSRLIPLEGFTYLTMDFLSYSSTLQIGNFGRDYTVYTIKRVQDTYIELGEEVEFSSDSQLYLGNVFIPLYHGNPLIGDYKPISQDKYINENIDVISSVTFNKALYFAYGQNGIWRYDGKTLENVKLPAPVNCFMRSIPNSYGFLPTVRDESKVICYPITVYITYSYINEYGQEIESPITSELGMTITPNASNDGSLSSEVIELQVPSIVPTSTFKTDILINVYRNGWYGGDTNGDIDYRLDEAVSNNPNSPYTRILIGRKPGSITGSLADVSDRKQLYSTVSTDSANNIFYPTNINPPLATKLIGFNNRLVAFNGSEDPYFNFRCLNVFNSSNQFDAFAVLGYMENKTSPVNYFFHTVTLGVNQSDVITCAVDSNANKPIGGYQIIPKWAPLYRESRTITEVVYNDYSNRFLISDAAALTVVDGNKVVLRSVVELPSDLPIDLNDDEFDVDLQADTKTALLYSYKSRWTSKENTSSTFLPTELTGKDKFAMFYKVGDSINNDDTNLITISASRNSAGNIINNEVKIWAYFTTGGTIQAALTAIIGGADNGKYVVIKGLGTQGGISLDDDVIRSWDSELVFQVDTGTGPAVAGSTCFNLTPVKFQVTPSSSIIAYQTPNITGANTIPSSLKYSLSVYAIHINATPATNYLTVSAFSNPAIEATITSSANIANTNSNIEIAPSTANLLPDHFPDLRGVFSINTHTSLVVKEIAVNPPIKLRRRTDSGTASTSLGVGALTISSYLVNSAFSLDVDGKLVLGIVGPTSPEEATYIPKYLYCLVRGDLFNSVSLQLSGWHEVTSATYSAGTGVTTITTNTVINSIDYAALNMYTTKTYPLSGVLYLVNNNGFSDTTPDYVNNCIPVPMPFSIIDTNYNRVTTDSIFHGTTHDLAMPMFSIDSNDANNPAKLVGKRFAGAVNSILGNVGFAYWGGTFGTAANYYPDGGFKFIPHRSYEDKYKYVKFNKSSTGNFYRDTSLTTSYILTQEYLNPFDKWIMRVKNQSDYQLYASIKNVNGYFIPQTYQIIETNRWSYTTFSVVDQKYPSRVWTTGEERTLNRLARQTAFKQISPLNIGAGDSEDLSGAVTFQNLMLFFKPNSIYRVGILYTGELSDPDKLQTTVGSVAGNNLISNEETCYFIHYTGIYKTNGFDVDSVLTLNRPFIERVAKYSPYFRYTTGFHDAISKEIHLGIPLDSTVTDSQFVYNYNDMVQGWSINTNIPATKWIRISNKDIFGTLNDGYIYQVRTETGNTKFSDIQSGIEFKLQTRYLSPEEITSWKFYKNVLFMFGSRYPNNPSISYAWDYAESFEPLQVFQIKDQRYGVSEFGKSVFGTTKHIEFRRRTLPTTRVANMAFLIEESSAATPFEIYKIQVEGFLLNTKYVKQNSSR